MSETVTRGYGTCPVCRRLKHVTPEATLRLHSRFEAVGTVVSGRRCAGSGAQSVEGARASLAEAAVESGEAATA